MNIVSAMSGKLITSMKDQGLIANRIFSFYLTHSGLDSFIELGGYDEANMKNPSDFAWIPCDDTSFFWTITVSGFKVGNDVTRVVNG